MSLQKIKIKLATILVTRSVRVLNIKILDAFSLGYRVQLSPFAEI